MILDLLNLTALGLFFNFIGSLAWLIDTLLMLRKSKRFLYPSNMKPLKIQKNGTIKSVTLTCEEIKLFIWLLLISTGFFLQILGYII